MEFDIEMWVPYRCDFKPITTNFLFSDDLGSVARLAMRMGSELLYMWCDEDCPVGTLAPENLLRLRRESEERRGFAMVFAYSEAMEKILYELAGSGDVFGAGVTICEIWKSAILIDECKALMVASSNPMFDPEEFLDALRAAMSGSDKAESGGVPYFAEKFGFRRFSIPYETDDITELQISSVLSEFEFDETKKFVGCPLELSLDNF
jgi:hypothetical protein